MSFTDNEAVDVANILLPRIIDINNITAIISKKDATLTTTLLEDYPTYNITDKNIFDAIEMMQNMVYKSNKLIDQIIADMQPVEDPYDV